MPFVRPRDLTCENFAALGPQLQQVAEYADDAMATMPTAPLLDLIDRPALTLTGATAVSVAATDQWHAFSFEQIEFTNAGGISSNLSSVTLPVTATPAWYYAGLYVRTADPTLFTRWRIRFDQENKDPDTGKYTIFPFSRYYYTADSESGDDFIWMETVIQSRGGKILYFLASQVSQGDAPSLNVLDRRFWICQMSSGE